MNAAIVCPSAVDWGRGDKRLWLGATPTSCFGGEGYDEALAVAWVSRLRAEGRRLYLVGVSERRTRGKFGVGLVVDIGLDEALVLAAEAALVVIPCAAESVQSFRRDPRFDGLLARAGQVGALVRGVDEGCSSSDVSLCRDGSEITATRLSI